MRSRIAVIIATLGLFVLSGAAHAKEKQTYQLGPTGLCGTTSKGTAKIKKVDNGSPADGKIKVGDTIIGGGVGSAVVKFKNDFRRELADAVNMAETEKHAGKLILLLKGNRQVELQLEVLGRYSATAPYNCPKSEKIITRAAESILKADKFGKERLHIGLLGLMATGEPKYIEEVGKVLRSWEIRPQEDFEALLRGEKDMGYVGWYWGYNLIALSEYYLLTKDESVLPKIRRYANALARGQDAGGCWGHRMATVKRNGRLPGYAQMNQPSLSNFMGLLLAKKCGITDPALDKGIAISYRYFESHVGEGGFPYGVHGPKAGTFNNNGTSGSAAICMALSDNSEGARYFSQICAPTYDSLEKGHASTFFNPLWTPLGANLSGPEVTQRFFKRSLWLQTMYRRWDGSFSRFGRGGKPGLQAGVALLAYCLPRKALYITGKGADKSIWLTGQAATDVIEMGKWDYKSMPPEKLMDLAMNHPLPQIRRFANGALGQYRDKLTPAWIKYLEKGTSKQKKLAIGQYGWWIAKKAKLPQMDRIGAVLRDTTQPTDVRAAAAGSLAHMGEPAHKYFMDMAKLLLEDRPDDIFGLTDMAIGKAMTRLCKEPFAAGLVTDRKVYYKGALKLANHKRQQGRAIGLRMLAGMPLEDFYIVADTVVHVLDDNDPTYHSYHNPTMAIGAAVTILANLDIKEGIDYAMAIQDMEGGKGGFKRRAIMDALMKYGPNAKHLVPKLKAQKHWKKVPGGKKLGRKWSNFIKAVESDEPPRKLISLEEAKKAGAKQ